MSNGLWVTVIERTDSSHRSLTQWLYTKQNQCFIKRNYWFFIASVFFAKLECQYLLDNFLLITNKKSKIKTNTRTTLKIMLPQWSWKFTVFHIKSENQIFADVSFYKYGNRSNNSRCSFVLKRNFIDQGIEWLASPSVIKAGLLSEKGRLFDFLWQCLKV